MDQNHYNVASDVGHAVVKGIPPLTIWALTLNEWAAVASLAYVLIQALYLIRKWYREEARHRRARDA